jgi:lipopolysaccharide export system protein LptA
MRALASLILPVMLLLAMPSPAQEKPAGEQAEPPRRERPPQPVEIVSDQLVVDQEQNLATFSGSVDAVQGELRLRADRLLVYYARGENGGSNNGAGAATDPQGIQRIEAMGNVVLIRPNETSKGDEGTYEPATGLVTLTGNVVLTRGQNVIRGARLESNQRTGVSTVVAAEPGAVRSPEQRVRALFTPGGTQAAGPQREAGSSP